VRLTAIRANFGLKNGVHLQTAIFTRSHVSHPRRIPHYPRPPNRKPVKTVGTSNSWDFL
jgi:hypothetical protein